MRNISISYAVVALFNRLSRTEDRNRKEDGFSDEMLLLKADSWHSMRHLWTMIVSFMPLLLLFFAMWLDLCLLYVLLWYFLVSPLTSDGSMVCRGTVAFVVPICLSFPFLFFSLFFLLPVRLFWRLFEPAYCSSLLIAIVRSYDPNLAVSRSYHLCT